MAGAGRRAGQPAAGLDRDRGGDARSGPAWPRASTRRSGRSASPPASPCSGTLFSSRVKDTVAHLASGVPGLGSHSSELATAIKSGAAKQAAAHLPAQARPKVQQIAASAFTDALNHILLVAAIIVIVSGVIALLTIRKKDLVHQGG